MSDVGSIGVHGAGTNSRGEMQAQPTQVDVETTASSFQSTLNRAVQATVSSSQISNELDAPPASADDETKLRWAAKQLEIMFMQELFKGMRRMAPQNGLFGQSFSLQVYQEMLDAELAKNMAQADGIGLSDLLLRQLRS